MPRPDLKNTIARIRAEYLEMPGLRLTFDQARRFYDLEPTACREALGALVDVRFLCIKPDGRYARFGGEDPFRPTAPQSPLRSVA